MGKHASAILAFVSTFCNRVDGRESFCTVAHSDLWSGPVVCGDRLHYFADRYSLATQRGEQATGVCCRTRSERKTLNCLLHCGYTYRFLQSVDLRCHLCGRCPRMAYTRFPDREKDQ